MTGLHLYARTILSGPSRTLDLPHANPDAAWMERAICRQVDPELWHPAKGESEKAREAKRICLTCCPVQVACLAYALSHPGLTGIWGGKTERERRTMRRQRHA